MLSGHQSYLPTSVPFRAMQIGEAINPVNAGTHHHSRMHATRQGVWPGQVVRQHESKNGHHDSADLKYDG